jgi:hypothetical protein
MKTKRFSVEQIVAVLKQAELGANCLGWDSRKNRMRCRARRRTDLSGHGRTFLAIKRDRRGSIKVRCLLKIGWDGRKLTPASYKANILFSIIKTQHAAQHGGRASCVQGSRRGTHFGARLQKVHVLFLILIGLAGYNNRARPSRQAL